MAVNIQRGRDHGLPDYNTARRAFGLDEITRWEDINKLCNTSDLIETADGSVEGQPDCRVRQLLLPKETRELLKV